jgi:chemotaxis protein CheX
MNDQIEQIEKLTQTAVTRVFHSMVSMELTPELPVPLPPSTAGQIIASVGFIGEATGVIYLYADVSFAVVIASRMLGIPEAEVDGEDMVNDAIGELSNMVVGYVKSHLQDGGLPCTLTIPSIVRGQHLSVEGSAQVSKRVIGFREGTRQLLAEILLKEPQTKE